MSSRVVGGAGAGAGDRGCELAALARRSAAVKVLSGFGRAVDAGEPGKLVCRAGSAACVCGTGRLKLSRLSRFCAVTFAGAGLLVDSAGEKGGGGVDGAAEAEGNEVDGSRDMPVLWLKFCDDACERGRRLASSACSSWLDIFQLSPEQQLRRGLLAYKHLHQLRFR